MSDPVTAEAIGVIDGANVDFNTPVAYYPGTLFVFLNGQLLPQDDELQGPIELGGTSFRLPVPPVTDDRLHVWFHTGPPTPGAFFKPPRILMAIDLSPKGTMALNLVPHPDGVEADIDSGESVPRAYQAVDLSPKATEAKNLVPRPLSAEEV